MVLSFIIQIDDIPLILNFKVNKKALPKPGFKKKSSISKIAPLTKVEKKLLSIWEEVLNLKEIWIDECSTSIIGIIKSLIVE